MCLPTKAELDVLGNSFGSKTVITSGVGFDYTYDNATGLYSATFTNEQLNKWYKDRWAPPPTRISHWNSVWMAQWNGGSEFEAPEVRKVSAEVKPIQIIIFDCDRMMLRRQCHSRNNRYQQDSRKRECLRLEGCPHRRRAHRYL